MKLTQQRTVVSAWIMGLALVIAAQCASPGEEAIPVDVTPANLTYVSWANDSDAWGKAELDAVEHFEASRPNIRLTKKRYAETTTRGQLTDADPPDIILVWPYDETLSLVEDGLLLDVTEIWETLKLDEGYPPPYITMAEVDGKKYYIPLAYSWSAIYYNKSVFEQLNLTPPETWDAFLAVSDTLWHSGVTPIALAGDSPWMALLWFDYLNLRLNGPEFHAALIRGEERYDDPRLKRVLETWQVLLEKEYLVDESWSWGYEQAISAIIKGDDEFIRPREPAAMLLITADWISDLPPKFKDELDYFQFPVLDPANPTAEVVTSMGYMIPTSSQNPSDALTFLAYLGSEETQSRFAPQVGALGTYMPTQGNIDGRLLPPSVQQGQQLVQSADAIGTPYFASIPGPMRGQVSGMLRRFLQGSTDIDTLLHDLEAARQRIHQK